MKTFLWFVTKLLLVVVFVLFILTRFKSSSDYHYLYCTDCGSCGYSNELAPGDRCPVDGFILFGIKVSKLEYDAAAVRGDTFE